jgi:NSS family neurotransmitter:Na+ symporter
MGFVLAAAGSAIGLGNLWKFPYITWSNNGGAFVLTYLVCVLIVGMPIMIAELLIGRRTQKSAVGALRDAIGPAWGIVGGIGVLTGFVILGYYTVVAGWTIRYFGRCLAWSLNGYAPETDLAADFGAFAANGPLQLLLSAVFMGATITVVYFGVGRGIEKLSRRLMPALFGILLLLLITALTMDGAGRALSFIFRPNFAELEFTGILEALGHSFFTLSLGMGAMITYGSYLKRDASVPSSAMVVVLLDTLIAICATIVMFSVIFSVPGMTDQIGGSTVGMLFISLPELFYTAVPMGKILAPLFYVLVGFAALTSTISLLEVTVAYFIDQRGLSRPKATFVCGGSTFTVTMLCGLSFGGWAPISNFVLFPGKPGMFQFLDHLAANWLLPVGGLLLTLGTGWFMTREASHAELIDEHTPRWFHYGAWRFFIRFVAPIAVAFIIGAVIFLGKDFS